MPFETEDVEAGVILGDVRCLADIATDPTAAAAATTKPSPPSQSTGGNGLGVGAAGAGARARAVQNRDLSRGLKWTTAHLNRKFFCSCQPIDGVQMSDAGVEFEDGDLVRVTPPHPLRGLLFYWRVGVGQLERRWWYLVPPRVREELRTYPRLPHSHRQQATFFMLTCAVFW